MNLEIKEELPNRNMDSSKKNEYKPEQRRTGEDQVPEVVPSLIRCLNQLTYGALGSAGVGVGVAREEALETPPGPGWPGLSSNWYQYSTVFALELETENQQPTTVRAPLSAASFLASNGSTKYWERTEMNPIF